MAVYEDIYKALSSISQRKNKNHPSTRQKSSQTSQWWEVYLWTAIFSIALFTIPLLNLSSGVAKLLEIGLVLLYYRTILRWVRRHEAFLNQEVPENSKLHDLSH